MCFLTSCPSGQQNALTGIEANAATGGVNAALGAGAATGSAPAGGGTIGAGTSDITSAGNFFQSLASGNMQEIMQTLQPSISSISSQYDTGRQAAEEFAPRGGGRGAALEELPFQEAGQISSLVQGAQQTGATGEANIGAMLSDLGLGELGTGTTVAANTVGQLQNQQQISNSAGASSGAAIGGLVALLAGL